MRAGPNGGQVRPFVLRVLLVCEGHVRRNCTKQGPAPHKRTRLPLPAPAMLRPGLLLTRRWDKSAAMHVPAATASP